MAPLTGLESTVWYWTAAPPIGAMIAGNTVDLMIFFWDPLESQPHDPDVKALLRIAVVWNIPVACNRASADYIFSSPLMTEPYERILPDYGQYVKRQLPSDPRTP